MVEDGVTNTGKGISLMNEKPGIATAIPRRRYRLGEFTLTVLGDIESTDGRAYRYIAAVICGQDPEPGMYITAESGSNKPGGELELRIILPDGAEVIDRAERWSDLDAFVEEVIRIVSRVLQLTDETPYQLM
jgi:hypothetical protein